VLSDREASAGPPDAVSMKTVGQYAYQVQWNDGHNTGIYTVAALRELAEALPAQTTTTEQDQNTHE
jgi:DUF971 family protein